jgi:hypothetical protein
MIVTCTQYNKEKRLSFHRGSVVASLLLGAAHNRLTLVVTSALNHSKFIGDSARIEDSIYVPVVFQHLV